MREILFRGQTRRKGEKVFVGTGKPVDSNWVYGGVFQGEGDFSIIYSYKPIEKHTVYTDTVGQFTGLTDKNGKKIFEGDIVKIHPVEDLDEKTGEVIYEDGAYYIKLNNKERRGYRGRIHYYEHFRLEVIGNIHDNPEILEAK